MCCTMPRVCCTWGHIPPGIILIQAASPPTHALHAGYVLLWANGDRAASGSVITAQCGRTAPGQWDRVFPIQCVEQSQAVEGYILSARGGSCTKICDAASLACQVGELVLMSLLETCQACVSRPLFFMCSPSCASLQAWSWPCCVACRS